MANHVDWFRNLTGRASGRAAALASGIPVSTLNRQLAQGVLSAEFVIALARGYGAEPVAELVATGYLDPKEASPVDVTHVAQWMDDRGLIRELLRRLEGSDDQVWFGTLDEVAAQIAEAKDDPANDDEGSGDATVHELRKPWIPNPPTMEELEGLPYVSKAPDPEDAFEKERTDHDNIP
ncbi:hypothetical protein [Prescottella equi]